MIHIYPAFNLVFNIKTDFAAVAAVDDQGNIINNTGSSVVSSSTSSSSASASSSTSTSTSVGDFGSCSVPQIEFGTGFDGRKETSFQPVDKSRWLSSHVCSWANLTSSQTASFNHGSAQAIDIISQFVSPYIYPQADLGLNHSSRYVTPWPTHAAQTRPRRILVLLPQQPRMGNLPKRVLKRMPLMLPLGLRQISPSLPKLTTRVILFLATETLLETPVLPCRQLLRALHKLRLFT